MGSFHQRLGGGAAASRAAASVSLALYLAMSAFGQGVRVSGSTPKVVSSGAAKLVRHMDPGQMLRLTMVLRPRNQAAFEQFLHDVQDRNSPQFHRFLTFDQWKARYAPADADVAAVSAWAARNGLSVIHRFGNNLAVKVEANTQTIEQAFQLQINRYAEANREFFSNDRDPAIAPELSGILKDVVGLSDYVEIHATGGIAGPKGKQPIYRSGPFMQRADAVGSGTGKAKSRLNKTGNPADPNISGEFPNRIEAIDLYSSEAYDLNALQRFSQCCNPLANPGSSPRETSIAIIGQNSIDLGDLQAFTAQYGMAYYLTQVMINGPSCCDDEMTLDIESATAMANSFGASQDTAHVIAYEGGGTHLSDLLDAWNGAHSDDLARNASSSFGDSEDAFGGLGAPSISDFTDVINAMAAEGWSMAVAAGDHGSTQNCSGLSVTFPASSPNVVAIGGTTLSLTNSAGQPVYAGEVTWTGPGCNGQSGGASNNGGGGGGCSSVEPAGFWQPASAGCGNMRALPDVSLNAGNPQAVYYGGAWQFFTGTSIGAPEFAGFLAQMNSYLLTLGNICTSTHDQPCAGFGNPNVPIYFVGGLNAMGGARDPFYDITSGCNGGDGQTGYCAGAGYDLATGWGSINVFQLSWIVNNYLLAPGALVPVIAFQGPATQVWYNTDQRVFFIVIPQAFSGTNVSVGVAGYQAQWDTEVPDILGHATPGSGDSFYDGPPKQGNTDYLSLAAAGQGCHTAHVRAWDNIGDETFDKTYGPLCYDTQPPVISCNVPATKWSPTDISVPCTASDAGIGLANPADASFSLATSVPAGVETSNAYTPLYTVADKLGYSASVQLGPFEVDKKAPSIAITAPAAGPYVIQQAVAANYTCTDGGSGVATCAGPAPSGSPIDTSSVGTKTFKVNAGDNVGNTSSQSANYGVTYGICPQFDPNQPTLGFVENIKLQICSFGKANLSVRKITLTATAVDGDPTKAKPLVPVLSPGNKFFFDAAATEYEYLLDVRGLASGAHTLSFTVAGDAVVHSIAFNTK